MTNVNNTFMEEKVYEIQDGMLFSAIQYSDVELCPYVVYDVIGRTYWFSPVTMEPVVIQHREGHA